jgi:flavin-dependent dehydrogenase
MSGTVPMHDVVVVGGGPGGSTTAAFLARGGLRVVLFEREPFPRFHVGESLMPGVLYLLDQVGLRETVETHGFQVKYGASFHDVEGSVEHAFYFLSGQPWPNYSFQVPRAEFDTMLLDHARKQGVTVFQPGTVESAEFDADGVTVAATREGAPVTVRARMLVDASGRSSFMASRQGRRERIPNLGKVGLFAHFQGADRQSGKEEGNIRIYVFRDGWFWWIPLAGDLTSVGAVMHARTVQAWTGSLEDLYAEMIRRCLPVATGLARARKVTAVHREANFSYVNSPVIGDRFVAVGDAITFVDPIFSAGVFVAMRTGQLAAEAILSAFRDDRFKARHFRRYERQVWRGVAPLFRFIHKYYEPGFFDLFMHPQYWFGIPEAVLYVLSGASFLKRRWRTSLAVRVMFALVRINTWRMRRAGRPVESRLEW